MDEVCWGDEGVGGEFGNGRRVVMGEVGMFPDTGFWYRVPPGSSVRFRLPTGLVS